MSAGDILYYENFDLEEMVTPVNYKQLDQLLVETGYPDEKRVKLVNGFKNGFDLGYRGNPDIQLKSRNLKFTVGNPTELWNKVMKEVKEKRYAGPFREIPFKIYIQSPIGLVPKDGGKKTRLIFHLSHPRGEGLSVNENTPEELSRVKYPDFDEAVRLCIKCIEKKGNCVLGKSDMTSAFRHLCIAKKWWKYLVMKAKSPIDNQNLLFCRQMSTIWCLH